MSVFLVRNCGYLTCFILEFSEAIIVEGPQDTVSFIGDTAVLRCRSNQSSMKWTRGATGSQTIASSSRGIHDGYPRMSLNTSIEGQFDLIIHSTQRDDADIYSCTLGFVDALKAELVLLGRCCCDFFLYLSYNLLRVVCCCQCEPLVITYSMVRMFNTPSI